jgi:hypothetical protein
MIVKSWEVSAWAQAISAIANDPNMLNSMARQNSARSREYDFRMLDSRRRSFYAGAIQLGSQ